MFTIILIVLTLLLIAQLLLAEKNNEERLTLLALESGFEALKFSVALRSPFFFLAILFVLFDLELILLFPSVVSDMTNFAFSQIWGITIRVIILTLALEWAWYGLKWQV